MTFLNNVADAALSLRGAFLLAGIGIAVWLVHEFYTAPLVPTFYIEADDEDEDIDDVMLLAEAVGVTPEAMATALALAEAEQDLDDANLAAAVEAWAGEQA